MDSRTQDERVQESRGAGEGSPYGRCLEISKDDESSSIERDVQTGVSAPRGIDSALKNGGVNTARGIFLPLEYQ